MKIGLHTPYIHTRFVDLMNCLAARVRLLNKPKKVMYGVADAMIGMWRAPHMFSGNSCRETSVTSCQVSCATVTHPSRYSPEDSALPIFVSQGIPSPGH